MKRPKPEFKVGQVVMIIERGECFRIRRKWFHIGTIPLGWKYSSGETLGPYYEYYECMLHRLNKRERGQ